MMEILQKLKLAFADQQNALIEFLKSLQVLAPGSRSLVVDENGNPKRWPPANDDSRHGD
jgi:hypothetical protein